MNWPNSAEDKQLAQYWDRVGGTLYVEVTMGGSGSREWRGRARPRRLDGVIVHEAPRAFRPDWEAFGREVASLALRRVTLIEAKWRLNRGVLGQSLVGDFMFKKEFAAHHQLAVEEPVVLYRYASPAMKWVTEQLGMVGVPFLKRGVASDEIPPVTGGDVGEAEMRMLSRYQASPGGEGSFLMNVPIAGEGCGVDEWGASPREWISFVRIPATSSIAVGVGEYDERLHRRVIDDGAELALVFVVDDNLVRGHIGTIAARALMFERQYGRPFTKCTIVCKQTDPAVEEACVNTGGTRGIPPVEVVALGR